MFMCIKPVRPQYEGTVKIAGLINRANVKITDIAGNLVFETISEGGWNGILLLLENIKVASGIYDFISAQDRWKLKLKK
jgi:hypothetical protein